MTDNTDLEQDETTQNNEPTREELIEAKAREKGWVPSEEWEGDPDSWRSAKEFLDRESFFVKIADQNRTISELRQTVSQLATHQKKIAETERARLIEELRRDKRLALEEGDHDRVMDIDEKIMEVKATPPVVEQPPQHVGPDPDFVEWERRNKWYSNDPALRDLADSLAVGYMQRQRMEGKQVRNTDVYKYVEDQVKKMNAPGTQVPGVMGGNRTTSGTTSGNPKSKYTVRDLTDDQKRIGQRFVEAGAYANIQEYVDDLVKYGDLR